MAELGAEDLDERETLCLVHHRGVDFFGLLGKGIRIVVSLENVVVYVQRVLDPSPVSGAGAVAEGVSGSGPVGLGIDGSALKDGSGAVPVGSVGVAFKETTDRGDIRALEDTVLADNGDGVVFADFGHFDLDHRDAIDQSLGDDDHAVFVIHVDVHAVPATLALVIVHLAEVYEVLENVEVCHLVGLFGGFPFLNQDGAVIISSRQIVPGDHQVAGMP